MTAPNQMESWKLEDFVFVTAFHSVSCEISSLLVELIYPARLKSPFLIETVVISRLEICSGHKSHKGNST